MYTGERGGKSIACSNGNPLEVKSSTRAPGRTGDITTNVGIDFPTTHLSRARLVPRLPCQRGRCAGRRGWGVSSRDGSRWKSVGVIESQQQRVFVLVGSCRESLGAIGSHQEPWEWLTAGSGRPSGLHKRRVSLATPHIGGLWTHLPLMRRTRFRGGQREILTWNRVIE